MPKIPYIYVKNRIGGHVAAARDGEGLLPVVVMMEVFYTVAAGCCLMMLALTCRVTTDLYKTGMSVALCGSLCNVIKRAMVTDYLQPLTLVSCIRLFFGTTFFLALLCQVAITLLKVYTWRRDGVPFDEVRVPFEEAVEDLINPVLERCGFTEEQLAKDATAIGLDGWRPQGVTTARSRKRDARLRAAQVSAIADATVTPKGPQPRLTGKQKKKMNRRRESTTIGNNDSG